VVRTHRANYYFIFVFVILTVGIFSVPPASNAVQGGSPPSVCPVLLWVSNVTIPNQTSFVVQLNVRNPCATMYAVAHVTVLASYGMTVKYLNTSAILLQGNSTVPLTIAINGLEQCSGYDALISMSDTSGQGISQTASAHAYLQCSLMSDTWKLASPLKVANINLLAINATFTNQANFNITGIVFAVFRNSLGQIVYMSTATVMIIGGGTVTAYLVLYGIYSGSYNVTVFAWNADGASISQTYSSLMNITF